MPAASEFHRRLNPTDQAFAMGLRRPQQHGASRRGGRRVDTAGPPRIRGVGLHATALAGVSPVEPGAPRLKADRPAKSLPAETGPTAAPMHSAVRLHLPPRQRTRRENARPEAAHRKPPGHCAVSGAVQPKSAGQVTLAAAPPAAGPYDTRPAMGSRHGFARQAAEPLAPPAHNDLRNILYTPFRAVNLVLAGVLNVLTAGWSAPLLAYAGERFSESLDSLSRVGHGTQAPEARSRPGRTGPRAGVDGKDADGLSNSERMLVSKLEAWQCLRARAARPARIKDACWRAFGRALSTGTGAWGLYFGCVALTAAIPPLGLAVAIVGGLGLWWSGASVLSAVKSLRRAVDGRSPQPLASSPLGNAWLRGRLEIARTRGKAHEAAEARTRDRLEAARAASILGRAWAVITLALSCVSAVQATALIARVVRSAASSVANMAGWSCERRPVAAGRGTAQADEWEDIDRSLRAYRDSLVAVRGMHKQVVAIPDAVQRALLGCNFSPADLEDFFSPGFGLWKETDRLRPAPDEALKVLGQLTDSVGVAASLRGTVWAAADVWRAAVR